MKTLDKINLEKLIGILKQEGYNVIGPVLKDGAVLYDEIDSIKDLPEGWEDEQEAGYYRLKKTNDKSLFSYVVGPQSWKKFLFPQRLKLWKAKREGKVLLLMTRKIMLQSMLSLVFVHVNWSLYLFRIKYLTTEHLLTVITIISGIKFLLFRLTVQDLREHVSVFQ